MTLLDTTSPVRTSNEIRLYSACELPQHMGRWETYVQGFGDTPLSRHPGWLLVLQKGLKHTPYCFEATNGDQVCGLLPLAYIRSLLFGRFLVGLPYLNYGGVLADDDSCARQLLDQAAQLADKLNVRYLEVRHERQIPHPLVSQSSSHKVNMWLALPATKEQLRKQLTFRVRNRVCKGERSDLTVHWGGHELLPEFYQVFSEHMRDLGTPVYGRALFR